LSGSVVSASLGRTELPRGTKLRSATINWGDGTHATVLSSLRRPATHTFAHAGHFTVRVKITDSTGQSLVTSRRETVVTQTAYWDLFNGTSLSYQVEYTQLPLTRTSSDTLVSGTVGNGLRCTAGMGVGPQHRLWIISYPNGCSNASPAVIQVFSLPFATASTPLFTLTIPGTCDCDNLTFDREGNVWVEDYYFRKVYEFTGPFTSNTTLVPSVTLSLPSGVVPGGLAVDKNGDLFVANVKSAGTQSIAIYRAPVTNVSVPTFLDGLTGPGGLTFDTRGNLYASNNPAGGKGAAIVRYDARNLKTGATPSVVDPAGVTWNAYEANFAWDASGNLYVADCGSASNVRVYPLATKRFGSKLAPSVIHRNASINSEQCVWGLAVG